VSGPAAALGSTGDRGRSRGLRRIVVCLDGSPLGEAALPHALALARPFHGSLTLLRVLEGPHGPDAVATDPLDWSMQRRESRAYVERLVEQQRNEDTEIDARVAQGVAAEQICLWVSQHGVDLTVVSTHGAGGPTPWRLGSTARKLLERVPGSLLLVPPSPGEPFSGRLRYDRILVPLDGSARAESALPVAVEIAREHAATLILAHVVPGPELTCATPLDADDLELEQRVIHRNQRVAGEYLDRLRTSLAASGLTVRPLILHGDRVPDRLARAAEQEHADLVVLTAHGRAGRTEYPCGSVAASLIERASLPLLLLREAPRQMLRSQHATSGPAAHPGRPPVQAMW
jgi:nucleotide-binding universal stress UspA family protein